jgi:tRNA(Ile)-lysidine synthetase-like protein
VNNRAGRAGLEQRVLARWRQLAWPASTRVVVGFSGGPDSLALAAVLARLASMGGPRPILVHVDHAWRSDSAAEQERAASLATVLGLPFQGYRVPAESQKLHPGVGREEAARRERYRLLAAAARATGTDLISLAHHQQDQAETILLHLLRGAGLHGVAGMRQASRRAIPWWTPGPADQYLIWRPFLAESGADVRTYGAATGLKPIEDPSNEDLDYRRNAIRQAALPVLERIVPGAVAALARFADLAAEDDAALTLIADAVLASAISEHGELGRAAVVAQPLAVQRRVARRWVQDGRGLMSMTAERTDAMLNLLAQGEPGRRLELGEGIAVRTTRDGLRFHDADSGRPGSGAAVEESR